MSAVVRLDTRVLDAIIAAMPQKAEELVAAGAEAVQGRAAAKAPVDTGALRNSISAGFFRSLLWHVGDGVEYGIYQELGTSRMAAQPFMVPAVEWARPEYNKSWRKLFEAL